jgi:hypothetical protein
MYVVHLKSGGHASVKMMISTSLLLRRITCSLLVVSLLVCGGLGQGSGHVQEGRDFLLESALSPDDIIDDRHPNDIFGT